MYENCKICLISNPKQLALDKYNHKLYHHTVYKKRIFYWNINDWKTTRSNFDFDTYIKICSEIISTKYRGEKLEKRCLYLFEKNKTFFVPPQDTNNVAWKKALII